MVTMHADTTSRTGHDELDRYIASVPVERRAAYSRLIGDIRERIDPRFAVTFASGMPSWVVPHDIYPDGYHVDPTLGVPFLSLANQRSYIAYYHMGVYSDPATLAWFEAAYRATGMPLNMGRSCIRFANPARIPFGVMAALTARLDVDAFLEIYERALRR